MQKLSHQVPSISKIVWAIAISLTSFWPPTIFIRSSLYPTFVLFHPIVHLSSASVEGVIVLGSLDWYKPATIWNPNFSLIREIRAPQLKPSMKLLIPKPQHIPGPPVHTTMYSESSCLVRVLASARLNVNLIGKSSSLMLKFARSFLHKKYPASSPSSMHVTKI